MNGESRPIAISSRIPASVLASAALFLGWLATAHAQDVHFEFDGEGETRAMTEWGIDTAWPSYENVQQSIYHMGADQVNVVRLNYFLDEPLDENGEIGPNSRAAIDWQLELAALAGDKPLALTPASESGTDPYYLDADEVAIPERWLAVLEATQRYIGRPIQAVEVFNEPDYWAGYGPPETLREIMLLVKDSPYFQGAELHAASTLCSCTAQYWYDAVSDVATHGTTHQLASWWGQGSDNYINFIQHVLAQGDIAYNPELHSMAEVLYGAEYGMQGGIWWADALRPRGLLVNAVQGKRLGYAELRWTDSAAAVYRAPDGEVYGFVGSFERSGPNHSYRFVSDDQPVYFNGIGPLREFMMPTWEDPQGGFVNIDDDPMFPALDGHRWKIVNRAGNRVLEVDEDSAPDPKADWSDGVEDGKNIRTAKDNDALHQKWDITRDRSGYYSIVNASTGKSLDDYGWSLEDGGNIAQWENYGSFNQKWWIEPTSDGFFYVHNGFSNLYMEDAKRDDKNVEQAEFNESDRQQWYFVPADAEVRGTLVARYEFDGNALDSSGNGHHGTEIPAQWWQGSNYYYSSGVEDQAINLTGGWDWWGDHVVLPDDVANSEDITIAAWVNWQGGAAYQRIFDFGINSDRYMFLTPSSAEGQMKFAITTRSWWDEQTMVTAPLPTNEWVHVAVTIGGNTAMLYVNGELQIAGVLTKNPSDLYDDAAATQQNFIGRSQWPDPAFLGAIDDFRIYDYALSATEIADLAAD